MPLGIFSALLTAIIQPLAYLCSRLFFLRGGRAIELSVYSQLLMGGVSLFLLLFFLPLLHFDWQLLSRSMACALSILLAQLCYFWAIRVVEASRLASMLGFKLVFLVFLNMLFFRQGITLWHWLAVSLCIIAGLVMNYSGLRLSLKALLAIIVCCFFLACSDIADYRLVLVIPSDNVLLRGLLASILCYGCLGLLTLPALCFLRLQRTKLLAAVPYSAAWMSAMFTFYLSVGLLGPVFTSIIQSSRGLVSVLLGALVAWLGHSGMESKASPRVWLGRLAAALMIIAAVTIFTLNPL